MPAERKTYPKHLDYRPNGRRRIGRALKETTRRIQWGRNM